MGTETKIAWCDHTFNGWIGCARISPACENCYAEALNDRYKWAEWGPHGTRHVTSRANWMLPKRWNAEAAAAGVRRRVFCASLADVCEDRPELVAPRAKLYALTEATPSLIWLMLTKRPDAADRLWAQAAGRQNDVWGPNVHIGTTVEDRRWGVPRIEILRSVPAVSRFLSCEPLLEDLGDLDLTGIHQVIVGGESGSGARVFGLPWARRIRDQCREQSVAFFCKQLGAVPSGGLVLRDRKHGADIEEFPMDLRIREYAKEAGQ